MTYRIAATEINLTMKGAGRVSISTVCSRHHMSGAERFTPARKFKPSA